jgi:hypothetical protein
MAGIVSTSDPPWNLTLSATLAKCRSTLVDSIATPPTTRP